MATVGLPYLLEAVATPDRSQLFVNDVISEEGSSPSRLKGVDLERGTGRVVDDAWSGTYFGASATFSADGRWMLFIDAVGTSIDAYDLAADRAYRVSGRFGTITQLAVLG